MKVSNIQKQKIKRISWINEELSFINLVLPLALTLSFLLYFIKFIIKGTWDMGGFFTLWSVLGIIVLYIKLKERRKYKIELRELKGEIGL